MPARLISLFAPLAVGVLFLLLWQGICYIWHIPPYLMPAPSDIAHSLFSNINPLCHALYSTLTVTLAALLVSVVFGVLVAFVLVQHPLIERSLMPYVVLMQVTPVVALAPLIIILVKTTLLALIVCATLIAIFPIISNTLQGLKSVDPGLAAFFKMHKASRLKTLLRLQIPSALPMFMAGLQISSGLALVGAVVAEFVAGTGGNSAGLAYEILQAGFQMDIPRMFAALFMITLTGLALYMATSSIRKLVLYNRIQH
ncbi:ABC transporter ATP-binding protein [Acetobacter pomorum]|uniref:ABC transporter ATP-binding protein n=1 Tax=Acetobacter pomorum TaxID=65959 RepID=A0A2G4RBD1_9PROT|nr:ABC transporter permease [Acetobacter pomorum]PHY93891.1 ABC transporter ATP-binding protein [Acetobacter pomorum]GBR53930.1 nitrate/sulfonate/bicarbonate transporter permease [Acetobacter pomorum DSM 11825]